MNKELFERSILDVINKYHMIPTGASVTVAVSGGADSVCLLMVLNSLISDGLVDASLRAVHVEHGIRGEESLLDAEYVKKLCEKLGVPLNTYHVNVPLEVQRTGQSYEEAARYLRYKCFEEEGGIIALAHHKNDQAETVLLNLVRGSAIRGLTGIKPVRDNYIRPLLFTEREQIEDYLKEKGVGWKTDSTNLDNEYSRNKVRNIIAPALREVNERALDHITETASYLNEIEDYLSLKSKEAFLECVKISDVIEINNSIMDYHKIIRERVIYDAICKAAGLKKDIGKVSVNLVSDLFNHQPGKVIDLPYDIKALRLHFGVRLYKDTDDAFKDESKLLSDEFEIEVKNWNNSCEISKEAYKKCFDYDKISSNVQIRRPKNSDVITIDKEGHTQNLKKFFTAAKIPAKDKDKMMVVADGDEIIWVVGLRISEKYKITKETKNALIITYKGVGGKHGRNS